MTCLGSKRPTAVEWGFYLGPIQQKVTAFCLMQTKRSAVDKWSSFLHFNWPRAHIPIPFTLSHTLIRSPHHIGRLVGRYDSVPKRHDQVLYHSENSSKHSSSLYLADSLFLPHFIFSHNDSLSFSSRISKLFSMVRLTGFYFLFWVGMT